jgi:predicted methyltransferase
MLLVVGTLAGCTQTSQPQMSEAVASSEPSKIRTPENIARDPYRHPVETLDFFEVKPDMTVVEISPGAGWYTEVIAERMKNGTLYLAIFADDSEKSYAAGLNEKIRSKIMAQKALYPKVHFTVLDSPKKIGPIAPDNSADRVLTFRNVHNWMKDGKDMEVFQSFYKALKPGGILDVVEHRAKTDKEQDPKASSGYVREDYVIQLAKSAGFKFVAKSEINANPKDTADHPKGVWTLPPSLRLKDTDKEKYLSIGESDRMTLKFAKPL